LDDLASSVVKTSRQCCPDLAAKLVECEVSGSLQVPGSGSAADGTVPTGISPRGSEEMGIRKRIAV
jgi:hypothetical protein